ncbi:MAG: GPW/gp25 family protein [Acidobacteria bacterium]|nr:GPW/gp25 family protein [Acidobacteriota bacterium]
MNIDYPLRFDDKGRTAASGEEDHIRDMIEQILFTAPGERINRPDFGCGLAQLVFEPNSPELAATTQFLVQASLQRFLGHLIRVETVEVSSLESRLSVEIRYTILRNQEGVSATFTTERRTT